MSCWPLLLLVLLGCSASSLQTPSQRRPYDRESSSLHPDVTVHRKLNEEVVDVYVSISREELLYSRLDSRSPFVAQLQITVEDTTWHVLDTAWADAPATLRQVWTYSALPAKSNVDIEVTDVLRNASWSKRIPAGTAGQWDTRDFLIWSQQNDWPLSIENAEVGDTLNIHLPSERYAPVSPPFYWNVHHRHAVQELPPPPYSSTRMRWDTLTPSFLGTTQADSMLVLVVQEGTTLLDLDNAELSLRIHGRRPNFPALTESRDLIAPLRYIAARSEYQRLTTAEHPKLALDEFWLACSSSPEAARNLLQTYYARVEEANAAFSGMTEGWRTDRGMIHVVFGVPQRIRRDAWNEYWVYGEEGTANALMFHFRRRRLALDGNAFELQRSLQFRSVWERGISNWRNGRVRGD